MSLLLLFQQSEENCGVRVLAFLSAASGVLTATAASAAVGLFVPFTPAATPGFAPSLNAAEVVSLAAEGVGGC